MFQYCEMDTDSAYIALAGDSIDDLVSTDARKPTTVSVQLTSAQLKASANVTTSSTKTPSFCT